MTPPPCTSIERGVDGDIPTKEASAVDAVLSIDQRPARGLTRTEALRIAFECLRLGVGGIDHPKTHHKRLAGRVAHVDPARGTVEMLCNGVI